MEKLDDDDQLLKKSLPEIKQNPKYSLLFKILFICLIIIVIALIVVVILLARKINNNDNSNNESDQSNTSDSEKKEENYDSKILENAGYVESWNSLYGIKRENISYVEESTMTNSFKNGEINFNDEIGIINEGIDYSKNENNKYNLYIPKEAINNKK